MSEGVDPRFAHVFMRKAVLYAQHQELTDLGREIKDKRQFIHHMTDSVRQLEQTWYAYMDLMFNSLIIMFGYLSLPVLCLWICEMIVNIKGVNHEFQVLKEFENMLPWDGPHDLLRRLWSFEAWFIQNIFLSIFKFTT